ncbi:hypothetical protein BOX17_00850 [Halomonas aestuarii]|uniref:SMODS-associating 2TM beta-strand rich effector domain-containing protein n=1 Tax=Halomonas aestuarii TaxID=1897729 RepID=A0A1J0VC76_9GAMM|nr:hypothetical protein [Halomonas aestuarii]APE29629.1 hypothetical protein BOX17_00850 [Halomonas aestuarii]
MKYARETLFYSVIVIFVLTATVTLLGVTHLIEVDAEYLKVLFSALVIELVASVIGLFKATDWFGKTVAPSGFSTIEGNWWQFIRHDRTNAVSFVTIQYSEEQQQVVINGDAYTADGEPFASWWSIGVSFNAATMELRYFYKGDHEAQDDDFSGVGYLHFNESPRSADGWYTSGNIEQLNLTDRPKVELRPAAETDAKSMSSQATTRQDKGAIAARIYAGWRK